MALMVVLFERPVRVVDRRLVRTRPCGPAALRRVETGRDERAREIPGRCRQRDLFVGGRRTPLPNLASGTSLPFEQVAHPITDAHLYPRRIIRDRLDNGRLRQSRHAAIHFVKLKIAHQVHHPHDTTHRVVKYEAPHGHAPHASIFMD